MDIVTVAGLDRAIDRAEKSEHPCYFLCADGAFLSLEAVKENRHVIADAIIKPHGIDRDWNVVWMSVNTQYPDMKCVNTGKRIPMWKEEGK